MNDIPIAYLLAALIAALLVSALLAAIETAMLALNRHRLRLHVKQKHRGALRTAALLKKTDRLLAVLQLGTSLVNVAAVCLATVISIRLWGEPGAMLAALALAALLMVFADQTPKIVGAMNPEAIAYPLSGPLLWLTRVLHPLAWLLGKCASTVTRALGFKPTNGTGRRLSRQDLRTRVDESAAQTRIRQQSMQLNVLDLEKTTVAHVMVPRNEVVGLDISSDIDALMAAMLNSRHTRLPVYKDDLNNVVGMLHLRNAARWMTMEHPNKAELLQLTQDAYFVPDSTTLPTQLVNFQKNRKRVAIVVDEYGVVIGLVTLEDLLDEIVGHVATTSGSGTPDIFPQPDGTHVLDGSTSIRDINRTLGWQLPTDGPKTLNGLLTEMLENIPDSQVGLRLHDYRAEILQTKDNLIKSVRMWRVPGGSDDSNEIQANTQD